MRTRYKFSLTALAITIAIISVYALSYRSRKMSFERRFTESFSRILEQLSRDPNYIVKANQNAHWGYSAKSDRHRLGGLKPDNPILDDLDLGSLHVSLVVLFEKKPTLLGKVLPSRRLPTGHWLNPRMVERIKKTIKVVVSNPTTKEMITLVQKVDNLKLDSDISITYYESRD